MPRQPRSNPPAEPSTAVSAPGSTLAPVPLVVEAWRLLAAGVVVLDAQGLILFANPAAADLLAEGASTGGSVGAGGTGSGGGGGGGGSGGGVGGMVGGLLAGRPLADALVGIDPAQLLPAPSPAGSPESQGRSIRGVEVRRLDRKLFVDLLIRPRPLAPNADGREIESGWRSVLAIEPAAFVTLHDATARLAAESELASLRARLSESEQTRQRLTTLQQELVEEAAPQMIGTSAPLQRVRDQVARVGPTDTTVLIHGETGSGKELVARAIHAASPRRGQAFVAVNCAALPETLIESELFGHERGAFTGADRRRLGKFELADGGTLFLDEIAELPLPAQAKLLRVIQESAFERVGGAETVKVNVRLLAATHRDLARQVERGRFREDLFYRLNVFKISVPPLRERVEDAKALITHLHEQFARRMGKPVLPISDLTLRRVMAYPWPGNVRELANAVERATLLADGAVLDIELPDSPLPESLPASANAQRRGPQAAPAQTRDILLDLSFEQLQRLHITHALETSAYRVFGTSGAAARLDVNPNTLLAKMDKFGIPRPRLMKRARKGPATP
jgi:DNA-binding NtrC family response regulator